MSFQKLAKEEKTQKNKIEESSSEIEDNSTNFINSSHHYYLRKKKPIKLNSNKILGKKRIRSSYNKKKKKKIKIESLNKERKKNEKTIKNMEKNNSQSLLNLMLYIDKKIDNKIEKKYCNKRKMTNEERKTLLINIKEKINKLSLDQIIIIQRKYFKNIQNENEVNLDLLSLSEPELNRLIIDIESFISNNSLTTGFIPYSEQIKMAKKNSMQNQKYVSIFKKNNNDDSSFLDNEDDSESLSEIDKTESLNVNTNFETEDE